MTLNLLILTSYFAIDLQTIIGGIGYRYAGLYGSLAKVMLGRSSDSEIFWYSHNDQSFGVISGDGVLRSNSTMLKGLMHAVSETLKARALSLRSAWKNFMIEHSPRNLVKMAEKQLRIISAMNL